MLFTFLLVLQAIIGATLVTVILMQRSEGGGLGMGGSPSGLMSARGAADFLTRATTVLATAFVVMSIVLAVLASTVHGGRIDASHPAAAPVPVQPAPAPANLPAVPGLTGGQAGAPAPALPTIGTNAVAPANGHQPAGVPFQQ